MGKFEQEASRKVLAGEFIINKTRFTFIDLLLTPYRILRNWNRKRRIRKNLFN